MMRQLDCGRFSRQAFTLVEILVVMAIIVMLAAILLPLLTSAKKIARRSASTSNLHQCGLALTQYADDNGGPVGMPGADAAKALLSTAPTCDPADTWRSSCGEDWGFPLIGSYAYARATEFFGTGNPGMWNAFVTRHKNPTLMMSIFYGYEVPHAFKGDWPDDKQMATCGSNPGCVRPDHALRLRLDGSVAYTSERTTLGGGRLGLSWPPTFMDDDFTVQLIS